MMGPRIRLYLDAAGYCRANWPKPPRNGQWLVRWIEGDLAGDLAYGSTLLQQARAVARGEQPEYRASGNAFAVNFAADGAIIYPHADEEAAPLTLKLADVIRLLERWQRLVAQ